MRLDYNILWIDNDIEDYIENGSIRSIEAFLDDLGFESNIVTVADEESLNDFIFLYKYDLIISDFNLNATTGDIIIKKIRDEKKFSTEILFYSAKSNFRDDPDVKDRLSFMDRITFHSNRDTFLEKVEKVIELTLDKLLELNATRGLITAATSDLDIEIESLVMQIIEKEGIVEDKLKEIITKKVFDKLEYKTKCFWDTYESFSSYFHKIDAVIKWEILRDLLKPFKATSDSVRNFLEANRTYQADIIDTRNKFAHCRAEIREGKTVLIGQVNREDFEFDTDACVLIRRNIISHKRSLDNFRKTFTIPVE